MTRTQRRIEELRKGEAVVFAGAAGAPFWVEQETHAFPFAYVAPLGRTKLAELFNPQGQPSADAARFDAPDHIHLGLLRVQLDRFAADGAAVDLHVRRETIGLADGDQPASTRRLTDLFALGFAHRAVRSIVWDGEGGLLRRDGSPTRAYRLLHKLIHLVWHSRADGATDADGRFRFRGFYGAYRVGVRDGDETKVFRLSFRPGAAPTLAPIPAAP